MVQKVRKYTEKRKFLFVPYVSLTEGLDAVLNREKREIPPRPKILDGKQEAEIIALRLGKPPAGFSNWTLRLLADQIVELEIADTPSYETVRRTLTPSLPPT